MRKIGGWTTSTSSPSGRTRRAKARPRHLAGDDVEVSEAVLAVEGTNPINPWYFEQSTGRGSSRAGPCSDRAGERTDQPAVKAALALPPDARRSREIGLHTMAIRKTVAVFGASAMPAASSPGSSARTTGGGDRASFRILRRKAASERVRRLAGTRRFRQDTGADRGDGSRSGLLRDERGQARKLAPLFRSRRSSTCRATSGRVVVRLPEMFRGEMPGIGRRRESGVLRDGVPAGGVAASSRRPP